MELSVTLIIVIATVVVSLMANSNAELYSKLMFNPYQVFHRKEWWRVFGHALIHDRNNIFHLVFNMYVLYSFGGQIERMLFEKMQLLGLAYYLMIYIGGIAIATLPALVKHKDNYGYNSLGASGGVSSVLFSAIAMGIGVQLIFLPIPMPPFVFGILYLAYEVYMDKKSNDNVAHDAHIWGAIFGFLFVLLFVPNGFMNFINQILSVFN